MKKDTIKIADHGSTKFVAHRGVSGLETENTAAAFIAAGNRSYYGVETDIWRQLLYHRNKWLSPEIHCVIDYLRTE